MKTCSHIIVAGVLILIETRSGEQYLRQIFIEDKNYRVLFFAFTQLITFRKKS